MPLEGCLLPLCDEWTRGWRNRLRHPVSDREKVRSRNPADLNWWVSLFLCKKKQKEAVCLSLSVITDCSADIFNCLHSSLSLPFLSVPLTFSGSLVSLSIFSSPAYSLSLYWLCIHNCPWSLISTLCLCTFLQPHSIFHPCSLLWCSSSLLLL